ncbi:MAG: hypothetical protein ACFE9C_08110 [Candidatus Hodarchaeota archaeon]
MSNGKGLTILALLIGISGLGLGVYTVVFPKVDTNFGIQNTWFNYDSNAMGYATSPPGTDIVLDALTINFTVNSGESVYFLFNTFAIITVGSPGLIQINFVLDGVKKGPPAYPEVIFGSDGSTQYGSVTLQIAKIISTGFHNLTIVIVGTDASNGIKDCTLLVQTYIP